MASRRILTLFPRHSLLLYFLGIIISSSLIIGCGTTKKIKNKNNDTSESSSAEEGTTNKLSEEMVAILATNRSALSDVYATEKNDTPDVFFKKSNTRSIGDPNQGYRIQILSTQNVAQADSIANDFRFWADSVMTKYIPKAYVFFRQPYYKVHIGNFQFHDQAIKLNRFLKSRYPGAWVVHDKIEPDLVPSDTVSFKQEEQ